METITNGRTKFKKSHRELISKILLLSGVILMLMGLFILTTRAEAANVTLAWDPNNPTPDGYRVFQRSENGSYDYSRPACDTQQTTCTIIGLQPLNTYYFVARAYMANEESGDSNEVNFRVPVPAPVNLRLNIEISVYIDANGKAIVQASSSGIEKE